MSEHTGEKTEQATAKRLEDALKKGQIARSPEVQTVFVLGGALLALGMTGGEMWRTMAQLLATSLSHLNTPLTPNTMQGYAISGALTLGKCVWPVMAATVTLADTTCAYGLSEPNRSECGGTHPAGSCPW